MLPSPTRAARTALAACALAAATVLGACSTDTSDNSVPSVPASENYATSLGVNLAQMTKKNDALYVQDLVVGTGAEATVGDSVTVHYTGWFVNGQMFQTSKSGPPLPLLLTSGPGGLIAGWVQGMPGMKEGGKRKLVIGSELAYGRTGNQGIPPNTTLVFDIELVRVH